MSKSIPLSKNHGLNPSIPVCFWCSKPKNELILLGRLPGDEKAPMNICVDYEPCDECQKGMDTGILMIEAVTEKEAEIKGLKNPPYQKGYVPTGRWLVVSEDFIRKFINGENIVNDVIEKGKLMVEVEVFQSLIDGYKRSMQGDKDNE